MRQVVIAHGEDGYWVAECLELPAQPPPKITANQGETATLV